MDGGCLNVLMLPNGNPGRDGGDCDVNIALSFILESVAQVCARVAVAASQNLLFFAFSRATEMALLPSPNAHALLKSDSTKALMHILESLSMFKGCFDEWSHPKWIFGDRSNHSQMLVKQYRAGNYARKYHIGNRGVTGKQLDSMFAKNRLRDLVQIDTLCSCDQDERHHVSASLDKDSNAHMAQLGDNKGPDTGSRLIGSGHVQWLVASKSDDDDDDDDDGDDDDDDDDDEYEGEEDEDEEEEEGGGKKGEDGKENNPVGEDGDNYDEESGPEDEDEDEDDDDDDGGDGDDDDDGDEGEADEEEEDDEDDEDEDEDEAAHEPPRKRRK